MLSLGPLKILQMGPLSMTWRCTFAMGRLALPIADPGLFRTALYILEASPIHRR